MAASVVSMIDQFNLPNIALLQSLGYEVDVACNFEAGSTSSEERIASLKQYFTEQNVNFYQVDFSRNIKKIGLHIKAYRQIKNLLKQNEYAFLHCHSPIGGVLCRLAAHKMGVAAIYTAHGFHFYKGASLLSWLLFYPIERFLARYTKVLITINKEDYKRAAKFKAGKVVYVPGVGIRLPQADLQMDTGIREEFGIPKEAVLLLSVGEMNRNKNHQAVIRAMAELKEPRLHYIICGHGVLQDKLEHLAEECGLQGQVHFAGFRQDISRFYQAADIFVFPSYREGLSVSLMEAMSYGLPIICSRIRGNTDLVQDSEGGYLAEPDKPTTIAECIGKLWQDKAMRQKMGEHNRQAGRQYSLEQIGEKMKKIYGSM